VTLRGYTLGEYLSPSMSSLEAEERVSCGSRWGATLFSGVAGLYGNREVASANRRYYPMWGAGLQFIVKPVQRSWRILNTLKALRTTVRSF
jgi:hypothetical protein